MNINDEIYSRTYGIYGDNLNRLFESHVAVIGLGGVGGALALSLARAGVGELTLVDGDSVSESNLNRQAIAYRSSLGRNKAEVCAEQIRDINPEIRVHVYGEFLTLDKLQNETISLSEVDYTADAIDDVPAKLDLIEYCQQKKIPIISSMGAGNKCNPCGFTVADISKTKVDPLARVIRQGLRKRGINHLKVVYSEEEPRAPFVLDSSVLNSSSRAPSSSPFVPSAAGLLIGSEIVKDLMT